MSFLSYLLNGCYIRDYIRIAIELLKGHTRSLNDSSYEDLAARWAHMRIPA